MSDRNDPIWRDHNFQFIGMCDLTNDWTFRFFYYKLLLNLSSLYILGHGCSHIHSELFKIFTSFHIVWKWWRRCQIYKAKTKIQFIEGDSLTWIKPCCYCCKNKTLTIWKSRMHKSPYLVCSTWKAFCCCEQMGLPLQGWVPDETQHGAPPCWCAIFSNTL